MKRIKDKAEAGRLRLFLVENLWLILLLMPLVLIVVLILQSVEIGSKQGSNRGVAMVVGTVEVSAVELASIVAKPFSELLAMDVYTGNGATLAAVSNTKINFQRVAYQHSYNSKPVDYKAAKLVSYEITNGDKPFKRQDES